MKVFQSLPPAVRADPVCEHPEAPKVRGLPTAPPVVDGLRGRKLGEGAHPQEDAGLLERWCWGVTGEVGAGPGGRQLDTRLRLRPCSRTALHRGSGLGPGGTSRRSRRWPRALPAALLSRAVPSRPPPPTQDFLAFFLFFSFLSTPQSAFSPLLCYSFSFLFFFSSFELFFYRGKIRHIKRTACQCATRRRSPRSQGCAAVPTSPFRNVSSPQTEARHPVSSDSPVSPPR